MSTTIAKKGFGSQEEAMMTRNRGVRGPQGPRPRPEPSQQTGEFDIEMPSRPDSSQGQLYSLFPAKKKKGRSRKSPEKLSEADTSSDWRAKRPTNTSSSFFQEAPRILPRHHQLPRSRDMTETWWPQLEDSRENSAMNKKVESAKQSLSFADMLKKPGPPKQIIEKKESKIDESKPNSSKKRDNFSNKEGSQTRQTKPCLTKVVLNQISASTYGRIGRSEDVSKYVMSGTEDEDSKKENIKTKPAAIRHDLEVEFREIELKEEHSDDDFEVEFSSTAPPARSSTNVVNKISAITFQQIGKTSKETEKYVMKPTKSWSSIVGKGLTSTHSNVIYSNAKVLKDEFSSEEEKSKGEPNPYDKLKAKIKEGEELTPEEREIVRQKRRERRKRMKENKKKEKEEDKRKAMLAPQTSKLHFISKTDLAQMNQSESKLHVKNVSSEKGIKFHDEEYPDLCRATKPSKTEKVISKEIRDENGQLYSDRESNSEWETDDDLKEPEEVKSEEIITAEEIKIISDTGPISYSSILKAKKAVEEPKPRGVIVPTEEMKAEIKKGKVEEPEKKKVKKKDPIEFDIFSALATKRQQSKKNVLGGKIKKEAVTKSVRNQLDSSAPSKKRGKEREGGKKKKKTLLKKIILAERLKKKTAREEAEKRREARIKGGVFLKPLSLQDDEINSEQKNDDAKEKDTENNLQISPEEDLKEDPKHERETKEEETKEPTLEEKAKAVIHTRKFRSYCCQLLSAELDTLLISLMADLIRFQDKQHAKDPVKAKARRRYIVGLREAAKFLSVRKLVCLVLAPDLEAVSAAGGLDDAVSSLLGSAAAATPPVPVVIGLNRRKMGRAVMRKVPVSCIGIMNPQGSDDTYKAVLELSANLRQQYQDKLALEVAKLSSAPPSLLPHLQTTPPTFLPSQEKTPPPPIQPVSPLTSLGSTLSEHAPAFVPSWERYIQYQPQYDPRHYMNYNQYQYFDYSQHWNSGLQHWIPK